LPYYDPFADTLDKISNPLRKPLSDHEDHKESNAKESSFKAGPATTVLTEASHAEKATSTATSGKAVTSIPASGTVVGAADETSTSTSLSSDRPLILYSFFETKNALSNLEFFIKHGLHGGADFVFIMNGETKAHELLPQDRSNIHYVSRPNHCFDLGAHAEVLKTGDLYMKYKRFILMNASIRGPYLPYWSEGCWSERYLKKVTEKTKVWQTSRLKAPCTPQIPIIHQNMFSSSSQMLTFPPCSSLA
jgi:hypothetical protein